MYRTILVPLDGSPFGEQALPLAAGIARRAAARLHLVTVHLPLTAMYAEVVVGLETTFDTAARGRSQAYLDALVNRLTPSAGVPVTGAVREGAVGEALQQEVQAAGADLVVMTTHGRGALARAWLGSVADDLVRRLPVPVLLTRPQDTPPQPAPTGDFRRVLIPLDGSALAAQVIEPALALGGAADAEYTLLRVIRPLVIGYVPPELPPTPGFDSSVLKELRALHAEERVQAQTYLDRLAEGLRGRSLRVRTCVAVHDQPAVAILDEAKAQAADLIALATHGRSGLPRLVLGSVADKVLRGASQPVLIQRPTPNP